MNKQITVRAGGYKYVKPVEENGIWVIGSTFGLDQNTSSGAGLTFTLNDLKYLMPKSIYLFETKDLDGHYGRMAFTFDERCFVSYSSSTAKFQQSFDVDLVGIPEKPHGSVIATNGIHLEFSPDESDYYRYDTASTYAWSNYEYDLIGGSDPPASTYTNTNLAPYGKSQIQIGLSDYEGAFWGISNGNLLRPVLQQPYAAIIISREPSTAPSYSATTRVKTVQHLTSFFMYFSGLVIESPLISV